MGTRWSKVAAPLLAVAALALGACGGDDDMAVDRTTTTSTGRTESTVTAAPTTAPGAATTAAGDGPATSSPGGTAPASPEEVAGPGVIEVSIVNGDVEGGVRREKVKQGSQVTIRVTSDVADELHVHTYDLKVDLSPGRSADLTFLARIPGVFEVELEARHKKVLELEVST